MPNDEMAKVVLSLSIDIGADAHAHALTVLQT